VAQQEADAVGRIEGRQDAQVLDEVVEASQCHHDEPERRDRPEESGDPGRAVALDHEQADEYDEAEGQDVRLEGWRDELQPLHRREHRDCRRDDGIAVEQGDAHHAERDDEAARMAERPLGQGDQGGCAALAVVVGAHDDEHVFQRNDEDEGP